ncbi:hypothetical protein BC827DRAFT_318907 [Russula dissimulans]|nr:hypothetical protein BC827DRAFT_318907 [Russula dissimulans]
MSESLGEGARGLLPYRTCAIRLQATDFDPAGIIQPPPAGILVDPSAEVIPPLSTKSVSYLHLPWDALFCEAQTQVHNHPPVPVHWGPEEQPYTFLPNRGIDLHAQTLYQSTRSLATASSNNYNCHLTSQMASRPQKSPAVRSPVDYTWASGGFTGNYSFPLEDVLHSAPSTREETGPRKIPPVTDTCPFSKCRRRFTRRQETERHALRHLPRFLFCNRPGCDWTGSRRYALRDHLKKKHSSVLLLEQEFMIYDAKRLVKQLLNEEITVEQAECDARSSFQDRGGVE